MTLTAVGLANAISTTQGDADDPVLQDAANLDLATAIITYLVANTVVAVTVAVDPGTHAGTGTGVIS